FHLIAGANTVGVGATGGLIRNRLDAAFLDRFVKLKVDYDNKLEAALCSNKEWVTYVQEVRAFLRKSTAHNVYITPRATLFGAAMVANGVSATEAVEAVLLAGCGEELKRTIKKNVRGFKA